MILANCRQVISDETVTVEANKAAILRDLKEKHNISGARLLHEKYLKVN
jgi:hypothetical protein